MNYTYFMIIPFDTNLPSDFFWFNKPEFHMSDGNLYMKTAENTDFWQRTHYGFSRDDGHGALSSVSKDFTLSVRARFNYTSQYDQCGLLLRIDALNWIKVSAERENDNIMRMGSVVTNLGYSDWATTDIDGGTSELWYRVECKENDFVIESSRDGVDWAQMRIAHLHSRQRPLNIGVYACSPKTGGFEATFSNLEINRES